MADNNFIKHAFVSPKSDGPDTTLVRPSNWNDGLVYAGGINGQILAYDNTQDNNMRWTEGVKSYVSSTGIANPTASPYTNIGTVNLSLTSPVLALAFFDTQVLVTGSANYTAELILDGSAIAVVSGLLHATFNSLIQPFGLAVGAHSVYARLTSVGNVNFTGGAVGIKLITFGV